MTTELVCIVCPRSCRMRISTDGGEPAVTGNSCKRGRDFAVREITDPRRTVCTTVRTRFPAVPVLPVRVSAPIPKDKIFALMREAGRITVTERLGRGDVVAENILQLGVDLIATSGVLKETEELREGGSGDGTPACIDV